MKFDKLNETIPYAMGGKEKSLTMSPYPNVTLAMPGRHAADTSPKGGDFVVMVTDPVLGWEDHQFTHTDLFRDVEARAGGLIYEYYTVIKGADPTKWVIDNEWPLTVGALTPETFLFAVQCLAVAEHRRYAKYEAKFGGRFLPFRFAAGIAEGLWTATDAAEKQKRGRPGVEWLEKDFGVPALTKELMNV